MPTGFFYAADLLGFGNIIRNSAESERTERISRWLALVDTAAGDAGVDRLQLISDTVFAAADSTRDGVASLVRFGQAILQTEGRTTVAADPGGDLSRGL
jgi:hypothetical protein